MNTQMHSLREQPQTLRNYHNFHAANDDGYSYSITELIGMLVLAFCVFFTVFYFAIPE